MWIIPLFNISIYSQASAMAKALKPYPKDYQLQGVGPNVLTPTELIVVLRNFSRGHCEHHIEVHISDKIHIEELTYR